MSILKPLTTLTLSILLLSTILLNIDSNAEYQINPQQLNSEEQQVIDTINKVDPQSPTLNNLKNKSGVIVDNAPNFQKEFDVNNKSIELTKDGQSIEIGTPTKIQNNNTKVLNNKIIYESKDNTVDLSLENVDGGVRVFIANLFTFLFWSLNKSQEFPFW